MKNRYFRPKIFENRNLENFWNRHFRRKFRFLIFEKISTKISIFQKMSKNSEKCPIFFWNRVFDQKFSIFFDDLFLNRSRIVWIIQIWRLEVPKTQRGRVSERNVEAYSLIKMFYIYHVSVSIVSFGQQGQGRPKQWNVKIWSRDTCFR